MGVKDGMCLPGLGPRDQSTPTGNPDTHLLRGLAQSSGGHGCGGR